MVPSYCSVPRAGYAGVLSMDRLCTSRGGLRISVPFHACNGLMAAGAESESVKRVHYKRPTILQH